MYPTKEALDVLESEWVKPKTDENGDETWGYELLDGAPEDIRSRFEELMATVQQ